MSLTNIVYSPGRHRNGKCKPECGKYQGDFFICWRLEKRLRYRRDRTCQSPNRMQIFPGDRRVYFLVCGRTDEP
jgi:hypothetical protein